MTEAALPRMTPVVPLVPAHLPGARAALFHLWRVAGLRPAPGETAPLAPVQAPAQDRVQAALQGDVFVFARTA